MDQVRIRIRIIDTQSDAVVDVNKYNAEFIARNSTDEYAEPGSIMLSYDGSDDKYNVLMTSNLTFSLLVKDGKDGAFYHLFTGSETRYRVELLNNEGLLLWQGFLLPDQYVEPWKGGAFFVNMTATDGVGALKGKLLQGLLDYGARHSVISYLTKCLACTGLVQDLYFCPAIESAYGIKWDQIYVDGRIYREEAKKSDVVVFQAEKRDDAYDILERLVHDIGCRLFSYEGKWFVIGQNQLHKKEWDCYRYSSNGAFIEEETVYQYTSKANFYDSAAITVVSPWKSVEVNSDYDSDDKLIDEFYYASEAGDIWISKNDYKKHWKVVGDIAYYLLPKDGKWVYTWTHPGQLIPDVKVTEPWRLGIGPWKYENDVRGSYIELVEPIWIQKSEMFELKYISFAIEMIAYSKSSNKQDFEDNHYGDLFRYELVQNNQVLMSSFPNSPKYTESAFEMSYSDDSIEYKDKVHHNDNFIETRRRISGKVSKEKINIKDSGYLQVRIYPPVMKKDKAHFESVAVQKLEVKLLERDDYHIKVLRDIDYSTTASIELFHIDNAQDNTNKRWLFSEEGNDHRSYRLSWRRVGVNENRRFGDCYARMYHSLQPGPHIKIDGEAVGVFSPLNAFNFKWMEDKEFLLSRLDINYTEAKTSLTMIESVIENVV